MKRSVLADSFDLSIYDEALSSDIHPGYFYVYCIPALKGHVDPIAAHFHANWYSGQSVENFQHRKV